MSAFEMIMKKRKRPTTTLVNIHSKGKNKPKPKYDVYIGRKSELGGQPVASKWANKTYASNEEYKKIVLADPELMASLGELEGKILGCWCLPKPCHGQVLIQLLLEERAAKR